jgi:hypothetical protein
MVYVGCAELSFVAKGDAAVVLALCDKATS